MNKLVLIGLLVLGLCFFVSAQVGMTRRIRLAYGDYDCSCSYHCPRFAIRAGSCYPDNDHHWGWGRRPVGTNCCVPSYIDYDRPDQPEYFY